MILVSGGAGVMGSRLVKSLGKKGNRVRVLTLPGDPFVSRLKGCDCEIVYGDVANAMTLKGLFDEVQTVYHLAAVIIAYDPQLLRLINTEGTRNMVDAAESAGVEHFVYVSSASAEWPEGSDYAESKVAAEAIVRGQTSMHYSIVRPTLVYEKGGGQEFMMFLESLTRFPVVPFVGKGRARKSPVATEDVVKGLTAIAGNPKSFGKTYYFSGGEEISIWDLAHLMLSVRGESRPFVRIPIPVCYGIAALMEMTMKRPLLTRYAISRIEHDIAPDNSEAREDLGYDPIGVSEGLKLCYGPGAEG